MRDLHCMVWYAVSFLTVLCVPCCRYVQGVTSTVGGISAKDKRAQELAEKAKKVRGSSSRRSCTGVSASPQHRTRQAVNAPAG
jgi:hypothetical protein